MPTFSTETRRQHWRQQVTAWQDSGQSQQAFCKAAGLNYPQFLYWRRKIQKESDPQETRSSGFVSVSLTNNSANDGLSIRLANGCEVRGIQANNLPLVQSLLGVLS
jgi:hypothetical protein